MSIRRQCALLALPRSTYYYEPATESAANLRLMRLMDEQYLRTPYYGSRRLAVWLQQQGYTVNRKRVQRLLRLMGLEGVCPKKRTTRPGVGHPIFPYLLRNLAITYPDQVWSTDITYIPLRKGYLYLVAVMDWYSRYVLSWRLSNNLEGSFCVEALEEALAQGQPEIQQRPGEPIHQCGVHGTPARAWRGGEHGWPRTCPGQRVHRTLVAQREIRGHLSQGLRPGRRSI